MENLPLRDTRRTEIGSKGRDRKCLFLEREKRGGVRGVTAIIER